MHRLSSLIAIAAAGGCHMKGAGSPARLLGHAASAAAKDPDIVFAVADAIFNVLSTDHSKSEADDANDSDDDEDDDDDEAERQAASAALAAEPPALDRAMIASSLARALPSLARCTRPAAQRVNVSIVVMPSGTVERVVVRDHLDPATAECVTNALLVALFPMTRRGGAFTYPLTL